MSEFGVGLVAGEGTIGRKAAWCVQSVRYHHPNVPILIVIPYSESVPQVLKSLDVQIYVCEPPVADYPQSLKPEALRRGFEKFDTRWMILLDTDTLVTEPLPISSLFGEVVAKPSDMGTHSWGRGSDDEWKQAYDCCDTQIPDKRVLTTVDQVEIYPYYNAGVLLTRAPDFVRDWEQAIVTVHNRLNAGIHSDQVALPIAASEYRFEEVGERWNYPIWARIWPKPPIYIIHYHIEDNLYTVPKKYRPLLSSIGINNNLPDSIINKSAIRIILDSIKKNITSHNRGSWWWEPIRTLYNRMR